MKKAKGDAYVWIKYVFNIMGRDLGIAGGKVKLMIGDKGGRKWSIRGIGTSKENDLFNDMLEPAYMRCNRHRRRKSTSEINVRKSNLSSSNCILVVHCLSGHFSKIITFSWSVL